MFDISAKGRSVALCKCDAAQQWAIIKWPLREFMCVKYVRTMLLSVSTNVFFQWLICFNGLVVFAYFARSRCDPVANQDITSPNQVIKYTNSLPP